MRKILLLGLLIIGNCILESCCKNDDECFELELSESKNFSLNGNYELIQTDTIEANNFALLIESKTIDKTCFIDFSTGGSLYAFDCDEPLYILKDEVTNISIISNSDLSLNYIAGSELKDLFIPFELNADCLGENNNNYDCLRDYSTFEGISSLEDAFNDLMATNFYLNEKEKREIKLLNLFSLKTEEIVIENNHQLTIIFDFESGKTVELKTDEIRIK
jgi:hypothetical protein